MTDQEKLYQEMLAADKATDLLNTVPCNVTADSATIVIPQLQPYTSHDLKLLGPYSQCPCGSGKKLKFCCYVHA